MRKKKHTQQKPRKRKESLHCIGGGGPTPLAFSSLSKNRAYSYGHKLIFLQDSNKR